MDYFPFFLYMMSSYIFNQLRNSILNNVHSDHSIGIRGKNKKNIYTKTSMTWNTDG